MSPLVWLFILLVSVLAAFFASLLTHALVSDLGALLIVGLIAGVGWYLFGPRPQPDCIRRGLRGLWGAQPPAEKQAHCKPDTDHAPPA